MIRTQLTGALALCLLYVGGYLPVSGIAAESNDGTVRWRADLSAGRAASADHNYAQADKYFTSAEQEAHALGDDFLATSLYELARTKQALGNDTDALRMYKESLKCFERTGHTSAAVDLEKSQVLVDLGLLYRNDGTYGFAQGGFKLAMELDKDNELKVKRDRYYFAQARWLAGLPYPKFSPAVDTSIAETLAKQEIPPSAQATSSALRTFLGLIESALWGWDQPNSLMKHPVVAVITVGRKEGFKSVHITRHSIVPGADSNALKSIKEVVERGHPLLGEDASGWRKRTNYSTEAFGVCIPPLPLGVADEIAIEVTFNGTINLHSEGDDIYPPLEMFQ
jgi:tetratricopeptide (TPR) repeat protein